jgi:hypothetical protein
MFPRFQVRRPSQVCHPIQRHRRSWMRRRFQIRRPIQARRPKRTSLRTRTLLRQFRLLRYDPRFRFLRFPRFRWLHWCKPQRGPRRPRHRPASGSHGVTRRRHRLLGEATCIRQHLRSSVIYSAWDPHANSGQQSLANGGLGWQRTKGVKTCPDGLWSRSNSTFSYFCALLPIQALRVSGCL